MSKQQAEGFLNTVRYVEEIRNQYSPSTKTDLDELGVILTEDEKEIRNPGYVAKPPPAAYWNLAGAMYAYLYAETAKLGIENAALYAQAFHTKRGKILLIINKRNRAQQVTLPADADGASLSFVAPSTNDHAAANSTLAGRTLSLEPFEVAVVQFK